MTQPDPYAGQGGSYRVDPKTGQRTLVSRTQDFAVEVKPATKYSKTVSKKPVSEKKI